ncbi:hypothetical protein [Domibacillus robiginosus]|uniref:hypothetical protein n=1 Tax=Domibacillus robiginosus TaxID=1071054 RepID=UPI00067CB021|nr:hypothetical protein [Domibacillus robiginosus]
MINNQLAEWIERIRVKFVLDGYTCFDTITAYEKNDWNKTSYRFITEWLPPGHTTRKEDESNPAGTAVVELDAKTGRLNSAVFVDGQAPEHGLSFFSGNKEEIIRFVEQETGWTYGHQFIDAASANHDFEFQTAYKGIPLSPEGYIHVSLDDQKKLTFFSVSGLVPDKVEESSFRLDTASVERLAKERFLFLEYPVTKEEKWLPLFMIDDVFVDNETGQVIEDKPDILTWKTAKNQKVKRKLVQMAPADIDPEKMFQFPPHPDTKPITKKAQAKIREAGTEFLQTYASRESGEWAIVDVQRANYMIKARLVNTKDNTVIPRMFNLFIDPDSYKVVNYVDQGSWITDMKRDFQRAEPPVLSKEEAFEKIKPYIIITPVYVYNGDTYRLQGKLDAPVAVHAVTGDIIHP